MTLSAAPFCIFAAFDDTAFGRVIVSWGVTEGLDVAKVRIEADRSSGFVAVDTVDATDGRIIDPDGKAGDNYRLIGEAADGELWIPTDPFTAQTALEPVCDILGTLTDAQGKPIFNAVVKALTLPIEGLRDRSMLVSEDEIEVRTGALGDFRLTLLQGLRIRIEIPVANVSLSAVVPEKGQAKFEELDVLDGDFIRSPSGKVAT